MKNGEALVVDVDFAAGEDIDIVSGDKSLEEGSAGFDVAALLEGPVKFDRAWFRTLAARARLRHRNGDTECGGMHPPEACKYA